MYVRAEPSHSMFICLDCGCDDSGANAPKCFFVSLLTLSKAAAVHTIINLGLHTMSPYHAYNTCTAMRCVWNVCIQLRFDIINFLSRALVEAVHLIGWQPEWEETHVNPLVEVVNSCAQRLRIQVQLWLQVVANKQVITPAPQCHSAMEGTYFRGCEDRRMHTHTH